MCLSVCTLAFRSSIPPWPPEVECIFDLPWRKNEERHSFGPVPCPCDQRLCDPGPAEYASGPQDNLEEESHGRDQRRNSAPPGGNAAHTGCSARTNSATQERSSNP